MARTCDLCNKKAVRANNKSHSQVKTPRKQKPNLQSIKIEGESIKICSTCRRTLNKNA